MSVSSRPRSAAISERLIDRPGPHGERKFNPLVLGQNQTTADSLDGITPAGALLLHRRFDASGALFARSRTMDVLIIERDELMGSILANTLDGEGISFDSRLG